jgi:hypothetical protein
MPREKRIEKVNQVIEAIASCGREFFKHHDSISRFEIGENSRLYFVEGYNGVYLPCWRRKDTWRWNSHRWYRFCGGGTLKDLVKSFAMYIAHGTPVPKHHFGPWPDWYCGEGDLWGYGEENMVKVREAAKVITDERP